MPQACRGFTSILGDNHSLRAARCKQNFTPQVGCLIHKVPMGACASTDKAAEVGLWASSPDIFCPFSPRAHALLKYGVSLTLIDIKELCVCICLRSARHSFILAPGVERSSPGVGNTGTWPRRYHLALVDCAFLLCRRSIRHAWHRSLGSSSGPSGGRFFSRCLCGVDPVFIPPIYVGPQGRPRACEGRGTDARVPRMATDLAHA